MLTAQRYYLTADRKRVVTEGDTEAHSLLYPIGVEVPDDDARKAGILKEEPKVIAKPPATKVVKPTSKEGA